MFREPKRRTEKGTVGPGLSLSELMGQRGERPSPKRKTAERSRLIPRDGLGWREEEVRQLRRPDLKGRMVGEERGGPALPPPERMRTRNEEYYADLKDRQGTLLKGMSDAYLAVRFKTRHERAVKAAVTDSMSAIDWNDSRFKDLNKDVVASIFEEAARESSVRFEEVKSKEAIGPAASAAGATDVTYLLQIARLFHPPMEREEVESILENASLLDLVPVAERIAGVPMDAVSLTYPQTTEEERRASEMYMRGRMKATIPEDDWFRGDIDSTPIRRSIEENDPARERKFLLLEIATRLANTTWKVQQPHRARIEGSRKIDPRAQSDFNPIDLAMRRAYIEEYRRADKEIRAEYPGMDVPVRVKLVRERAQINLMRSLVKDLRMYQKEFGIPQASSEGDSTEHVDPELLKRAKNVLRAGNGDSSRERMEERLRRMSEMTETRDEDFSDPEISFEELRAAAKEALGPSPTVSFEVPPLEIALHEAEREWQERFQRAQEGSIGELRGIAHEKYDATGGGYEFDGYERRIEEGLARVKEHVRIREERQRASNQPGLPDDSSPALVPDPLEIPRDGAPLPVVSVHPGWRRRAPVGEGGEAKVTPVEGERGKNLRELTDVDLAHILKEVEARSGGIGEQKRGILQKLSRLRGKFLLFGFVVGITSAIPNFTTDNDTAVGGSRFSVEDAQGDADALSEPELLTDDDFAREEQAYVEPPDSLVAMHALTEYDEPDYDSVSERGGIVTPLVPRLYEDQVGRVVAFGRTSRFTDGDWQAFWLQNLPGYHEAIAGREVLVYGDDQRLYRYRDGRFEPTGGGSSPETLSATFRSTIDVPTP